ncbi:MAG: AAA family ATPase, partial [Bdellovibrionia bacterium]
MPHLRNRHSIPILKKLGALWPVVGVLGPRQTGKTTLVHSLLGILNSVSLDELESREEAIRSPSTFLAKKGVPLVLDEVQKAPALFDEIKLRVDRKRIPGNYFLTGSSSFSSKLGIRESLTGRMGLLELLPMTVAELHEQPFRPLSKISSPGSELQTPRFDSSLIIQSAQKGGMPVPSFFRDSEQRDFYWRSWLETSMLRDLSRFFTRRYDPDFAFNILARIGAVL